MCAKVTTVGIGQQPEMGERETKRKCCTPGNVFRFLDSVALLIVIGFQMTVLNLYMLKYDREDNMKIYFWFIGDLILLIAFIITLIISYRFILVKVHKKLSNIDIPHIEVPIYGTLPFGYICWFSYGGLLTAKIVVIFQNDYLINELPPYGVYSIVNLKVALALTTLTFILLINTEHNAEPNTERNSYIGDLCKGVAFDLFDSIFFLSMLIDKDIVGPPSLWSSKLYNNHLRDTIIALACMNFLLPALSLMKLSLSDFGEQNQPIRLSLLVKTLKLFCINLPYMIVRIYLYETDPGICLFLVKNALGVLVSLRYMIPEYIEACSRKEQKVSVVKPIQVIS